MIQIMCLHLVCLTGDTAHGSDSGFEARDAEFGSKFIVLEDWEACSISLQLSFLIIKTGTIMVLISESCFKA